MNPFVPVAILLVGVAVLLVGSFVPRSRGEMLGLVPVAASVAALLAALALGFRLPVAVTISNWPAALFGAGLTLSTDWVSWLFLLAILVVTTSVFLTGLARAGGPRLGARVASLLVSAAALAAVQAQNLITLAITWAILDAVYFVSLLWLARGASIERQAALSLTFNSMATFCMVAAALDTLRANQDVFLIGVSPLTGRAVLLLLLAVLFRLGIFPFHFGVSSDANLRQGLGTLLRLAPAAVALDLLAHIMTVSPELPLRPWLSAVACAGLWVGAVQWWEADDPRQGVSYVILVHSSLALLAALWGGALAAAGVVAFGLAAILGIAVMFLNNGLADSGRAWVIPVLIGAYGLIGGPLTVGYVGMAALYGGFIASGAWLWFVLGLIGQMVLAAVYIRLALWPGDSLPTGDPVAGVAYLFGLAMPLLFAVIGGLAVNGITGAVGAPSVDFFSPQSLLALGIVALIAIGGVGLWRFEGAVRARIESATVAVTSAARLGWAYSASWEVYRLIGRVLRTTADIIEGEGGVLWTIVAALLVWLLFRG